MADHVEEGSTDPKYRFWLTHLVKMLAVAGSTFAIVTPGLMSDGHFTANDSVTLLCAIIASVSALFVPSPLRKPPPNVGG